MKMNRAKFVLFGDSITQGSFSNLAGWGAALANHYARKADVILRGYSGYNTRWAILLLNEIFPQGTPEPPTLVTVFFGANDASLSDRCCARQHVPVEEYKDNLCKIVSHLHSLSKTILVVLITPPPVAIKSSNPDDLPSRTNDVTGIYANACLVLAQELGVPAIDLWSTMQREPGWEDACLSDGLHLSSLGNKIVFEELSKILDAKGLAFESLPWDFPRHDEIDHLHPTKTFSSLSI